MHHFYLPFKISGDTFNITDVEQIHHIRDVLRLKPGDEVSLFDSEGNEYVGTVVVLGQKQVALDILSRKEATPRKCKVSFACAVPKKSLMDDIVDKLTQLGVDVIIPLETERVIVRLEENRQSRLERWRKIARGAAEQSHRNIIPSIPGILDFKTALNQSKGSDLKLIPTLGGARKTLKEAVAGHPATEIFVLIGPEGDFTPREVEQAVNAGFIPISLGDSILRAETAAIAVAGYLRFYLG